MKRFIVAILSLAMILSVGIADMAVFAAGESGEAPAVTSISYPGDISRINYKGSPDNGYSFIKLTLSGSNLDKLTKSDFSFKMDDAVIELDDTADFIYDRQFHIASADSTSAEVWIVFPENELEQSRECSITVLCAGDDIVGKTKTYTMDPKPESTDNKFSLGVDDWKAIYASDGTIKIRFDVDDALDLNIDPSQAKDYIFFASNNSEPYDGVVNLTDEDRVSMSGNVLTIDLAEKTGNAPGYYVILKTGTLKNSSGKILGKNEFRRYHCAYITLGAHIEGMSYSSITLGSEGGDVNAKIKGTNLKQDSENTITVKVFCDSVRDPISVIQASDVAVNADGTEAAFTFSAPANDSDRTVSYRLIPVLNGTNAITTYIKGYDVISVLPEGASPEDVTLASVEIQGAYDMDDDLDVFKTSTSSEQFTSKIDAVIRGTNLSSKKTSVKAVDENGVTWPMLPVFECGATIRWQNSSTYLPEKESKNEQHIELLLPRRLGVPRTFKLYFAPDGSNYDEGVYATVIIENKGLFDQEAIQAGMFTEEDFTELRDITVKYVDESGKELAPSDHYKGYGITELYHQGIAPKEIAGYRLKGYTPDTLDDMLTQPVQHTTGEYIFPNGQWFVKDLKDAAGVIQPITYIYTSDSAASVSADASAAEAARQGTADPKLPKVKIAKSKVSKKSVTAKWKKLKKKQLKKGVTNIEIWVCPDKNFAVGNTKEALAGKKKASKKIKGLAKGTYYVKVRAIRKAGGVKYVGPWSKVKKIKVKK